MTPRLIAIAIIVGASASIVPVAAWAQDCRAGCRADTKTCVQANRVTMLACKEGCRIGDPTSARSCRRGCTTTFQSAKSACLTDRSGCVGVCAPPSPPGSCDGAFLDACGRQLATCARGVFARAKACVAGCKTAADRLACLQTCAQTARNDATLCGSGFDDCTAPCRPTTTTTLPHLCGPGATVGTCGGECPSGLICAPPPSPSAIALACVCQSPSGLGRCFITVDRQCSDEPCGPGQPCINPNEICSPACLATTTTTTTLPGCTMDTQCDDGNPCTADRCIDGACEHACLCLDATGATSCCPGPAALCARPCGVDASGTCGGTCPAGATCGSGSSSVSCGCVSGLGGPCGGNVLVPPPTCAPGLVCEQSNPDATGKCVADTCVPFFASGCTQTSDCCSPCSTLGRAPCFVCLQGQCIGAP